MYWMRRLVFAGVFSLFGGVGVPALAVEISGSPVGPLTLDELFAEKDAGRITSATLIWQEGTPNWIRADAHPVFDN